MQLIQLLQLLKHVATVASALKILTSQNKSSQPDWKELGKEAITKLNEFDNSLIEIRKILTEMQERVLLNPYLEVTERIKLRTKLLIYDIENYDDDREHLLKSCKRVVFPEANDSYKSLLEQLKSEFAIHKIDGVPSLLEGYSKELMQSDEGIELCQYSEKMSILASHCISHIYLLKTFYETAYKYLEDSKEAPRHKETIDVNKLADEIIWNNLYPLNNFAFDLHLEVFGDNTSKKKYKCNIIKKQDKRALDCDIRRGRGREFQIQNMGTWSTSLSEPPVYIDYELIKGNKHQIWNISKFNQDNQDEKNRSVKITPELDETYRLGVYIYKIYQTEKSLYDLIASSVTKVYFVGDNTFEFVGVVKDTMTDLIWMRREDNFDQRSEWQIILTGDEDYILLKNCKTQKALDGDAKVKSTDLTFGVTDDNKQWILNKRQVYADISLDRRNEFLKWKIQKV